jgi:hypothetical protein
MSTCLYRLLLPLLLLLLLLLLVVVVVVVVLVVLLLLLDGVTLRGDGRCSTIDNVEVLLIPLSNCVPTPSCWLF